MDNLKAKSTQVSQVSRIDERLVISVYSCLPHHVLINMQLTELSNA